MMSFNKVLLIALYSSLLTVFVQGRETIFDGSIGGAGGGSSGREDKATSTTSLTSDTSTTSSGNTLVGSSTVSLIPAPVTTESTTDGNSNGKQTIESSTTATFSNVGSSSTYDRDQSIINNNAGSSNTIGSTTSNTGDVAQNFGTTGSLADRPFDVLCPICNAVPDKSYDESKKVNMGDESWTCGYLQETVQDVDQFSPWPDEAGMCRQSQLLAEDAGCCAQTMYINLPGKDLNDPCSLCGSYEVPMSNRDKLVNTGLVGSHTCGGIAFAMSQSIFSANMCPQIRNNIKAECCFHTPAVNAPAFNSATGRSSNPVLRGAVVP